MYHPLSPLSADLGDAHKGFADSARTRALSNDSSPRPQPNLARVPMHAAPPVYSMGIRPYTLKVDVQQDQQGHVGPHRRSLFRSGRAGPYSRPAASAQPTTRSVCRIGELIKRSVFTSPKGPNLAPIRPYQCKSPATALPSIAYIHAQIPNRTAQAPILAPLAIPAHPTPNADVVDTAPALPIDHPAPTAPTLEHLAHPGIPLPGALRRGGAFSARSVLLQPMAMGQGRVMAELAEWDEYVRREGLDEPASKGYFERRVDLINHLCAGL